MSTIQRAIDRWIAQEKRAAKRRTPADPAARVNVLRAKSCPRRGRAESRRSLALIEAACAALAEIEPASVRAVCYRLFTVGLISAMSTET